ncbi:hypothetical protein K458DRAFT_377953 [Lentithecium fluviatile CBS 122367]|uniref:Telomeric single stranded DNA binding POT1/Cdc13 domain-containing protein n=1 Tax=Lentithecium fluviatile CBS 122367 TaxID=1168545 RepID=A0A6G1II74_9PLEO|nr:hypothetical protein K458DRAFT_377953 [Lentithecium fluviatile CBS 122367]
MEPVAIAELTPELPALNSKHFRAVVALIWPYSSSARQFALLLGDPDFRRRRQNGQVRVRFLGSSAKAIARTGVGIGDEVVLSLHGAQFVQDGSVSTPGKSIDWELSYTQTLSAQVIRNGTEIATVNLNNVAPTPAPRSPVRQLPHAVVDEPHKWSSPAFIKRTRLSEGPIFEAGYDPFNDDTEDRHDRKRRRKSYRDWKAWTYSARTPSPEKKDVDMEDDYDAFDASPIRPANLPETPTSNPEPVSVAGLPLPESGGPVSDENQRHLEVMLGNGVAGDQYEPNTSQTNDDFVRDADYYDLYAGPNEFPPAENREAYEGDTEPNTEDEDGITAAHAAGYIDTIDADAEDFHPETPHSQSSDAVEVLYISDESERDEQSSASKEQPTSPDYEQRVRERSGTVEDPIVLDDAPEIIMPPPPTLPLLQTDFQPSFAPGMLTPIGKEPSSPTLLPLDSATLPMPSPFPGERDGNATSYLDHVSSSQPEVYEVDQNQSEDDEEYEIESSFYSSTNASNAPAVHPTHESAFTDVRFTFGMDGSALSRPRAPSTTNEPQDTAMFEDDIAFAGDEVDLKRDQVQAIDDADEQNRDELPTAMSSSPRPRSPQPQLSPEVIELSSGSESEDSASDHSEFEHEPGILRKEDEHPLNIPGELSGDHEFANNIDEYDEERKLEDDDQDRIDEMSYPHVKRDEHLPVTAEGSSHDHEYIDDYLDYDTEPEPEAVVPITKENDSQLAPDSPPDSGPQFLDHDIVADSHPDIKMESIEEEEHSGWHQLESSPVHEDDEPVAGPSAELLITIPEEGHEVGAMQVVSVPATGPARNTRSKTKTSMSPVKEDTPGRKRNTRSKKSKESIAPIACTTLSPFGTRSISTASPTKDAMVTSPYSLRSQSKQLSPAESTTPIADRRDTRKRLARLSSVDARSPPKDPFVGRESFHSNDMNPPNTSFGPSQQLGMSQGKFANVLYVKDSEEGSLHSDSSLSTVRYSDDWNMGMQPYTNSSDPARSDNQMRSVEPFSPKPLPTDRRLSPATPTQLSAKSRRKKDPKVVILAQKTPQQPDYSFLAQLPQSSPSMRLGSMTPTAAASSSPRRSPRLRSNEEDMQVENELHRRTSHPAAAHEVVYPTLPTAGERYQLRSSPSASPVTHSGFAPVNQQSLVNSNMPMTPDATQQTFAASQPSFPASQQEQSMPLTPQLTQTTSAGLRSFKADIEMEEVISEPFVKPSPLTKSTPRRNSEPPSIGLSTPIAYYTPIKDLPFFLNRSSQFHSSSHPDVLALATSDSTSPKRASSGPKHHTTTFHITDPSSHPTSTTVQVFRPYENALPIVETGDVVLLRAFAVRSLNRWPVLVSGEESAWCVWRMSKMLWGKKTGPFGELREREEVRGPAVERGEGEWREVEKVRAWYLGAVKAELEEREKEKGEIGTRSVDKGKGKERVNGFEGALGEAKL